MKSKMEQRSELAVKQYGWSGALSLTYSAATGMNDTLVIQHYMTYTFICLFSVDKILKKL